MKLAPDQYFSLLVPLGPTLLGLALLGCWLMMRKQRFLLWLAAGYIVSSLTLSTQGLMNNQQLAQWSIITGASYLGSFWSMAHGVALRSGGRINMKLALAITLATMAALTYYSRIEDNLWARAGLISLGLGLLLLLPFPALFRKPTGGDTLEKVLRISYMVLVFYTLGRSVFVLTLIPAGDIGHLTRSIYWAAMLSIAMLSSIWFLLVLLTLTLRDLLRVLNDERNHDSLTHLLNRRAFFEAAEASLKDPGQQPWTVLACDIDHFKKVNDTWGHQIGDKVLHEFSQVLLEQVRRQDMVARFGGEEFVMLLTRASPDNAQAVAERIRRRLAQISDDGQGIRITASFGLTPVSSADDLAYALERADTLLYEAKRAGRDRILADGPDANQTQNAA